MVERDKKIQILHDLKRISQTMVLLQQELDRLYEDIKNNDESKEG